MNPGYADSSHEINDFRDTAPLTNSIGASGATRNEKANWTEPAANAGSAVANQFMRMSEAHDRIRLRLLGAVTVRAR